MPDTPAPVASRELLVRRGRLAATPWGSRLDRIWRAANRRWSVRGAVDVGEGLRLGSGSTIWSAHGLHIGRCAAIGRRCVVQVDGTIGDYFLTGPGVLVLGRADHDIRAAGTPMLASTWVGDRDGGASDRVDIGHDVWIGAAAIVLGGVTIGSGAVVGAGAVVTRDVPAFAVAAGNPARVVGRRFTGEERVAHLRLLAG